jgi:hypothetical protein
MQYTHHLMVLMGEDMTMPDVAARLVKGHLYTGNLIRQGYDHVFGCVLDVTYGLRKNIVTWYNIFQPEPHTNLAVMLHHMLIYDRRSELPTIKYIEVHKMEVHRVGITGSIVNFPNLSVTLLRVFGGGCVPGDGSFHLPSEISVYIMLCIRPVNRVLLVIGGRLCGTQQRLQPSKLVHAFEQRYLANADILNDRIGYIRISYSRWIKFIEHAGILFQHYIKSHDSVGLAVRKKIVQSQSSTIVTAKGCISANIFHYNPVSIQASKVDNYVVA